MKKKFNLKRLMVTAVVGLTIAISFISLNVKADVPVIAPGCKYTGIENDECIILLNGGLWAVTGCKNNTGGANDCGFIPPVAP